MLCPKCHTDNLHRVQRKGFFQTLLGILFGFYPWHCTQCKTNCNRHKRHERRSHEIPARRNPPNRFAS
jgi:hypothetical protein